MKIRNYIKISALSVAILFSGCKKDYLDTVPTDSTSPATVFETTENARGAINGLSRLMKRQYLSSQGFNGEGTIKMYYGNYSGNNFSVPLPGWSSVINLEYVGNPQSTYVIYPWFYYYTIIGNANAILANIDAAVGPDSDKEFIKAQALTFRAYCYMMLVQLYGDRWADSNNGATAAVVLKTNDDVNDKDVPVSSLADAYQLIYDDLTDAIAFYQSSGQNRKEPYEVNIDVAYATFARAALTKQDYPNAEKYAALARANHPLMDVSSYKAGFANPTSEWIWSIYDSEQETIYFYSFAAYIAYNSTASAVRLYPKSISKELFDQIPDTDIRKSLFLNPEDKPAYATFDGVTGAGNTSGDQNSLTWVRSMYPAVQTTATPYAYMQFKFANNAQAGVAHVPNFRSSEMILIEAEAKYFQNKPATEVQALLNALNRDSGRDPSYNCTLTGAALLNEIKKYRGIELWGEGYDFFDMKRWGDTIKRKSFADGGNFQTALATEIKPSDANKWKLVIPQREADYNEGI